MITPTIATKENNKAASIIILSLLQWEDHIDFGKNLGQRTPLMNRSDKKNDDCGISAARHQTLRIGRLPPPACAAIARPPETGAVASGDDRPVDPAPLACSVPASRIALRACSARRRAAHFLRQRNARRHLETVNLIELPKLGFWLRLVSSTAQKVVDPSFRASLLRLPLDTRRALDGR
jgi:hypothetical protein